MDAKINRYIIRTKLRISCNVILSELHNIIINLSNHYGKEGEKLLINDIDHIIDTAKYFEKLDKTLKNL